MVYEKWLTVIVLVWPSSRESTKMVCVFGGETANVLVRCKQLLNLSTFYDWGCNSKLRILCYTTIIPFFLKPASCERTWCPVSSSAATPQGYVSFPPGLWRVGHPVERVCDIIPQHCAQHSLPWAWCSPSCSRIHLDCGFGPTFWQVRASYIHTKISPSRAWLLAEPSCAGSL